MELKKKIRLTVRSGKWVHLKAATQIGKMSPVIRHEI